MHNGKNSNNFGWEATTICDKKKTMLSQAQKNARVLLDCSPPAEHFTLFWKSLTFLKICHFQVVVYLLRYKCRCDNHTRMKIEIIFSLDHWFFECASSQCNLS